MNDLELITKSRDADRVIEKELHHEIDRRIRNRLVDESEPGPIRTAMLSCVNGRWDDLIKDVQRNRITQEQAFDIVAKIRNSRLIGDRVADAMRERVTEQIP